GVAGFEPATPSSRTRECSLHPLKYQRFSIASVPIRSRSIHAKLWPTCGRLATGAGGHPADVGLRLMPTVRYLRKASRRRIKLRQIRSYETLPIGTHRAFRVSYHSTILCSAAERTRTSAKSLIFFAAILTTLPETGDRRAIDGGDSNIKKPDRRLRPIAPSAMPGLPVLGRHYLGDCKG